METGSSQQSVHFTQRIGLLSTAVILASFGVIITASSNESQEQRTLAAASLNQNVSQLSLNCSVCRRAGRQMLCLDRQRRVASCTNKPPAFGYCVTCGSQSGATPTPSQTRLTPAPNYPTPTPDGCTMRHVCDYSNWVTGAPGMPTITPVCYYQTFCPTPTPPLSATGYPVVTPTGMPVPPGCYYQSVQCIQAPCNPILVCPTPTYAPNPTPVAYCCRVPYTCPNGSTVYTYLTNHGSNADRVNNGGNQVVCQFSGFGASHIQPGDFKDAACSIPWSPQTACQ